LEQHQVVGKRAAVRFGKRDEPRPNSEDGALLYKMTEITNLVDGKVRGGRVLPNAHAPEGGGCQVRRGKMIN
jgi:hypothetical protein